MPNMLNCANIQRGIDQWKFWFAPNDRFKRLKRCLRIWITFVVHYQVRPFFCAGTETCFWRRKNHKSLEFESDRGFQRRGFFRRLKVPFDLLSLVREGNSELSNLFERVWFGAPLFWAPNRLEFWSGISSGIGVLKISKRPFQSSSRRAGEKRPVENCGRFD